MNDFRLTFYQHFPSSVLLKINWERRMHKRRDRNPFYPDNMIVIDPTLPGRTSSEYWLKQKRTDTPITLYVMSFIFRSFLVLAFQTWMIHAFWFRQVMIPIDPMNFVPFFCLPTNLTQLQNHGWNLIFWQIMIVSSIVAALAFVLSLSLFHIYTQFFYFQVANFLKQLE